MRISAWTLLAVLCFASASGCARDKENRSAKATRVSATKAFEKYFGPAPTTNQGTCFAFVIYFPSAKEPGKVVPFPFFSFDQASLKKVALERLLGGMEAKPYAGEFPQLFPTGTRLLSIAQSDGTVTANFSRGLGQITGDKAGSLALYNAIILTEMQFEGVKSVRIQSETRDLYPVEQAPPAEASVVQQPAAPRLLGVVAVKGAKGPIEEVDALFDRPVEIRRCRLATADGAAINGDVYQAMFDMAGVLKPKEPVKLAAGTKIRVSWQVTDKVGRSAGGEDVLPLEVKEHQD